MKIKQMLSCIIMGITLIVVVSIFILTTNSPFRLIFSKKAINCIELAQKNLRIYKNLQLSYGVQFLLS